VKRDSAKAAGEPSGVEKPEPPRRRARGERTRAAVLEATLRLLAREGPRGVTHRAVAQEAGTSLRATTYYFASREELLTEALQHYAESAIARFDALAVRPERLPKERATLLDIAAGLLALTVVSDLTDDREGLVAEYELVLETTRHPALEPTYAKWQARLLGLLEPYARALGSEDPATDARIVLAMLRGLEIEALARPSRSPNADELRDLFRRLLERTLPER
jgi:DNA-binding transcriptional regulator YbjK